MTTRLELTPYPVSGAVPGFSPKSFRESLYLFIAPQPNRLLLVRGLDNISWTGEQWSAETDQLACIELSFRELAYAHPPRIILMGNGTLSWTNPLFAQRALPPCTEVFRRLGSIGDCAQFSYTEVYEGNEARHVLRQRISGAINLSEK
jgi:hypothetical protein